MPYSLLLFWAAGTNRADAFPTATPLLTAHVTLGRDVKRHVPELFAYELGRTGARG